MRTKVHVISIVPRSDGKFFEARFVFDDSEPETTITDITKVLSIDLGVNNLCNLLSLTEENLNQSMIQ